MISVSEMKMVVQKENRKNGMSKGLEDMPSRES